MNNKSTIDDLIQQVDMDNKRIVMLEKKVEELLDWRLHDKGAAPMLGQRLNDLERKTEEQWIEAMRKIEDDTLTPEWGRCVYSKIGEIEEKLLTPLSKTPPSQDCATYYESLNSQMKQLKVDQDTTMNQVSNSLLPEDMIKRLEEMEKKIFTYKELKVRGIDLKKEEEV